LLLLDLAVEGAEAVEAAEMDAPITGLAWSADGRIAIRTGRGVSIFAEDLARPVMVLAAENVGRGLDWR